MRISVVGIINIVLLLALFGFCLAGWPSLPERIPVHFGLDGVADGWAAKSFWSWFALPLIATAVAVLLNGLGRLVPRRPELLNVPDKKAYLALTPEQRAPVIAVLVQSLGIASAIIVAMMLVIQIASYRTALGHNSEGLILAAVIVTLVGMPMSALVMITRIQSRITAALRAQRNGEERA